MASGLRVTEDEFLTLPTKKQMCLLYKNQCVTLKLIEGYRFSQKVQYTIITALAIGVGLLFKIQLGI